MTRLVPNSGNDIIYTPSDLAERIISKLALYGTVLEPCRGDGAFYSKIREPKKYCELQEGIDFLEFTGKVEWVVTNPLGVNLESF